MAAATRTISDLAALSPALRMVRLGFVALFLSGCDVQPAPSRDVPAHRPAAAAEGRRPRAQVVEVRDALDGDTVRLRDGRTVRYLGVDSPERGEFLSEDARRANRRLLSARRVELLTHPGEAGDRYGRVLGVLHASDSASPGLCVSAELLRQGLAWVYQRRADSVPGDLLRLYLDVQGEAIQGRRGVWSRLDRAPEAGDLLSTRLRLHRRSCPHLEGIPGRPVTSLEAELRRGKSPCRTCRPLAIR